MDLAELHRIAVSGFDARVRAIGADQWENPTPCTEWSVRDLVRHLVNESLWTPELLAGKTLEEVGTRFDGELLGDDPVGVWASSAEAATDAVAAVGDFDDLVHVSWGQIPARDYVEQLTSDYIVHAWDLAKGIDGDTALHDELVAFAWDFGLRNKELIEASGVFGSTVEQPEETGLQARMLGLFGRRA